MALASLLASQPSLISTKLARIFPVLSSTTFLIALVCVGFFFPRYSSSRKEAGGHENAVITCKVHVAEAYSRPHRSVCVPSDLAIRNTAHRPFRVRTLCLSPPLGFFSPSPLPLTSLFTSLLFCSPPPPLPLRSTCPALPLSSTPPNPPSPCPSPAAGLRRDGGGQEQVLHPVQHVLHLGHRGPVPLPGQDPRQESAPGPGGNAQHSRSHDQPDQRRYLLPHLPSGPQFNPGSRRSTIELGRLQSLDFFFFFFP